MREINLPKSFKDLSEVKLNELVNQFVAINKDFISKEDWNEWNSDDDFYPLIPQLFIVFLKGKGFTFRPNSESSMYYRHDIISLKHMVSKFELDEEKKKNKLFFEFIQKELYELKKKKSSTLKLTVYKCFNDNCEHWNSDTCDTIPINEEKIDGIITDCSRFSQKGFKFKTWNQVLDISPER
jgi:hypothetical protein